MMNDDPFAIESTSVERILTISSSAALRIKQLQKMEENNALMLRITVSGGGCSGFQYGFNFDAHASEEDLTFEKDGVTVVTDEMSMDLLAGSEVDFVNDLMGAYFKIENPNATANCGCGTSFSI